MTIEVSGLVVRADRTWDFTDWLALCPEYDIASAGASLEEAIGRLCAMIENAVDLAREHRLAVGRPVSPEQVANFLAGREPIVFVVSIDTDSDPAKVDARRSDR